MGDLPVIQTAYDMKALTILMACDIMKTLTQLGDHNGAYALKCLVETIETIPCKDTPND
jgi:hypothetical protein